MDFFRGGAMLFRERGICELRWRRGQMPDFLEQTRTRDDITPIQPLFDLFIMHLGSPMNWLEYSTAGISRTLEADLRALRAGEVDRLMLQ